MNSVKSRNSSWVFCLTFWDQIIIIIKSRHIKISGSEESNMFCFLKRYSQKGFLRREQIQFVFFWYTKCSSAIAQIWIYGAFFVTKKSFNNEKLKKSTKWPKYTKTVYEVCHNKWYLVHVIELFSLYFYSPYLFSILVALFLLYFSLPISSYLFLLSAHQSSLKQSLLKFSSVKARIHCEMFLSDYFMKCVFHDSFIL